MSQPVHQVANNVAVPVKLTFFCQSGFIHILFLLVLIYCFLLVKHLRNKISGSLLRCTVECLFKPGNPLLTEQLAGFIAGNSCFSGILSAHLLLMIGACGLVLSKHTHTHTHEYIMEATQMIAHKCAKLKCANPHRWANINVPQQTTACT